MHTYVKGARTERELLFTFYSMGYSVLRSAGSGVNSLGPDIIAIKDGTCFSFECKAWEKSRLSLDRGGFEKLRKWKENTKFPTFVAWRMNNMGWYFIELEELKDGGKDFSITRRRAIEIGRRMEHIGMGRKLPSQKQGEAAPGPLDLVLPSPSVQ